MCTQLGHDLFRPGMSCRSLTIAATMSSASHVFIMSCGLSKRIHVQLMHAAGFCTTDCSRTLIVGEAGCFMLCAASKPSADLQIESLAS